MEEILTVHGIAKMALELSLGVCIKLFCDNGRIHWRDFVNDFLGLLPGMTQLAGDGLSRHVAVATAVPATVGREPVQTALAAK